MSTGNFYAQDRSLLKRYLIITIPLGLILLGLLFVYSLMTKPFEVKGDTRPKGLTSLFSIYGFEGDRLHRPTEVAVDGNNNIYVADSDKHRILIFDDSGNYIESFGKAGKEKYELWYPSAIAVADNGKVFVACKQSNKVVIFDSSHEPIWEIRTENPLTLTVKKNRLYITTPRGIMVGDLNGNLVTA
ncbi:MAG TPA: 6-bladed beta-propeller, partial [Anaerolineae bacterium]|nr:6-bladed beta-propeller [Anaerolineae bacterium]